MPSTTTRTWRRSERRRGTQRRSVRSAPSTACVPRVGRLRWFPWLRSLTCERDGDLGALRELSHDFGEVAVRVPDPQLVGGAVPAGEDFLDPLELTLAAEIARMRLHLAQRSPDELGHRHAVATAGGEVHDRRLDPVTGGKPLVFRDQEPV